MQLLLTAACILFASQARAIPAVISEAHQKHLNEPSIGPGRMIAPFAAHDKMTFVAIAFKTSTASSAEEIFVEIPLRRRISPSEIPNIPQHPGQARILTTFTINPSASLETETIDERTIVPADQSRVICMAYPKAHDEKDDTWLWGRGRRRETFVMKESEKPVWWHVEDGVVNFEDSMARWWLKGQEVGAYECF